MDQHAELLGPVRCSRRTFLRHIAGAALGAGTVPTWLRGAEAPSPGAFSFVFLGDLHFDKVEHHDAAWLQRKHPADVSQVRNYSRITQDIMPALFATVRGAIADWNRSGAAPIAFVLQAGDVVEGLCGSEERSVRQNQEALAFIGGANLGLPFLFTKGNHDVTGDGAKEAFGTVFHPFLTEQLGALNPVAKPLESARFVLDRGNAQFAFFDAYEADTSLEWLEAVAARRRAEHFFVLIHPPVVPYGARSNWDLFSAPSEGSRREKLLALLGSQRALVLGGHIHRFNAMARRGGRGVLGQFAISSVINHRTVTPSTVLSGLADYTPDQVRVEPHFSPANERERRAVYVAERPFVTAFDYADLPGYSIVTVDGPRVTAQVFSGVSRTRWRTVDLSSLLTG